jgi:hypothetical protein
MAPLLARLATIAAVAAVPALGASPARPAAAPPSAAQITQAAQDAYIYGIPLMEFVRTARQQTSVTVPTATSDAPLNQLGSNRQLANAHNQVIVQPNNDTPYTMAHVDLSGGPLILHVPAVPGHRYYSFEFLDPYTNVFAYVGTRTTGDGAGNFVLTGPGFQGHCLAGYGGSAPRTSGPGWSAERWPTAPPTSRPCTGFRTDTA